MRVQASGLERSAPDGRALYRQALQMDPSIRGSLPRQDAGPPRPGRRGAAAVGGLVASGQSGLFAAAVYSRQSRTGGAGAARSDPRQPALGANSMRNASRTAGDTDQLIAAAKAGDASARATMCRASAQATPLQLANSALSLARSAARANHGHRPPPHGTLALSRRASPDVLCQPRSRRRQRANTVLARMSRTAPPAAASPTSRIAHVRRPIGCASSASHGGLRALTPFVTGASQRGGAVALARSTRIRTSAGSHRGFSRHHGDASGGRRRYRKP